MQYTETQLAKLIEDVEKEFTAHLAKAEAGINTPTDTEATGTESVPTLAKAEESEKKPEEKKDEKPKEEPKAEAKEEHKEAPKEEPKHEEKPAEAKEEAGHDYDEEDMAHLEKMYMSMSKAELKVHHDKCRAAMDKCGDMSPSAPHSESAQGQPAVQKSEELNKSAEGKEQCAEYKENSGGKIESTGEPKGSPGAKSPASKVEGVQMEKSEQNTEVELLKSELNGVTNKYEELKKNFDAVAAFLTKLVEKKAAPAPKAITSLEAIAKSEGTGEEKTLTKNEIQDILLKKSSDPTLKKSDRELINAYYLSNGSLESINHLLK